MGIYTDFYTITKYSSANFSMVKFLFNNMVRVGKKLEKGKESSQQRFEDIYDNNDRILQNEIDYKS